MWVPWIYCALSLLMIDSVFFRVTLINNWTHKNFLHNLLYLITFEIVVPSSDQPLKYIYFLLYLLLGHPPYYWLHNASSIFLNSVYALAQSVNINSTVMCPIQLQSLLIFLDLPKAHTTSKLKSSTTKISPAFSGLQTEHCGVLFELSGPCT